VRGVEYGGVEYGGVEYGGGGATPLCSPQCAVRLLNELAGGGAADPDA
jgi:hypothetical protein